MSNPKNFRANQEALAMAEKTPEQLEQEKLRKAPAWISAGACEEHVGCVLVPQHVKMEQANGNVFKLESALHLPADFAEQWAEFIKEAAAAARKKAAGLEVVSPATTGRTIN